MWRARNCLPAPGRYGDNAFVVGNKLYIAGGYPTSYIVTADVWEYNPSSDTWVQKNNLPAARNAPSSFVINDTAYLGLGSPSAYGGSGYTDFYRYDAGSDTWTAIAPFPGQGRTCTASFSINGKGYVGGGFNGTELSDFYEYDPSTNTWTQKASIPPSTGRESPFYGVIGNYAYVGLGLSTAGVLDDVYKYDPFTDTWTQLANFPGTPRDDLGYFVINDTLYITGGEQYRVTNYSDCWRYEVASDTWTQMQGFGCIAVPREFNNGGSINGHGFVVCGADDTYSYLYNQLLEFGPVDTAFAKRVHVLGSDTSYCGNFSRILSTGVPCSYWSTGDTASQITVNSPGSYWALVNDTCGVALDTIRIAQTTGDINLGADTSYCSNFSRILSTGNPSTVWSTGVTAAQITVSASGSYWAYDSSSCGISTDTITISDNSEPFIDLGGDTSLCSKQTITLYAGNTGAVYRWQDNSTDSIYLVSVSGTYSVTVTNVYGCSASDSVNIDYASQLPQVNLGSDTTLCGDVDLVLNPGISNSNYRWQDNSTDSIYNVSVSGSYSVTVSNGCGTDSNKVNILILRDECSLLIPTAFSPNGDGANDLFRVHCHCPVQKFTMHIYNRWGEEVYSTNDVEHGWDGTYKSLAQPLNVFVYYIEYLNYCDNKMKKVVGNVTLLR